jgi:hypothetical protein
MVPAGLSPSHQTYTHQAPAYLPCQLPEEGLEGLVNLLFREHLLHRKERG